MADAEPSKPNVAGCLLVVIPVVGLFIGAGIWLGQRKDAAKTPCQRYADVVIKVLRNCHSGLTKMPDYHIAICEQEVDPTPACLEKLESLSCEELKRPAEDAAGAACARK